MTAALAARPPLAAQVGCADHPALGPLFERVRHEAMTVPDGWVTGYGEYQSGGWGTLSLLNDTGNPRDVTIADANPVPTTLLERMPATAALLRQLGLPVWWARLALMRPDSWLWEHADYTEPGIAGTERHRVHLPLVTSPAALLVTGGQAVHMAAGRLWRLTPTAAHGAANMAGPARLHLILDCHAGETLNRLRDGEELPRDCVRELPAATDAELAAGADAAARLARLGYARAAEIHLLRLYFTRMLPADGHAYDMIAGMHAGRGDHEAAQAWRDRKALMLDGAR